jgi:predicted DNA-binding transcriptional regulator AlpA
MKLIASNHVAAMLGIKTGTLAKWRSQNRGPKNWIPLSTTLVAYPEEEVARFIEERKTAGVQRKPSS